MRSKLALAAALAAVLSTAVGSAQQQRETRDRGILVSVSTNNDAPVADLTIKDFVVKENGVAREIIRVSPAPPPSHVMLLLDDSHALTSNAPYLRSAMTGFISALAAATPSPQFALMTFGERPTRRVDFTPNPDAASDWVKRLFPITNSGAYFLQAISDACRDLRKREAASPVIVAFVAEGGPEFSNELHSQIATELKNAGASLWAVTLQQGSQPALGSPARERAAVLGDVTVDSGGMNRVVLSGQALESGFGTLAKLITSRYLVVYGRPESMIPPDKIEVSSPRSNVRVRASRWAGR